jgi:benzoylformate decarboxylase
MGSIKATLPLINNLVRQNPPAEAANRNENLRRLDIDRRENWDKYLEQALKQNEIGAVVIAEALREAIQERSLEKQFVYVHEAVSDPAPFQYFLPLGTDRAAPISYYCVAGGSLGWSMPASLGIKLESSGWQGIETRLVVNVVGDGSSLF